MFESGVTLVLSIAILTRRVISVMMERKYKRKQSGENTPFGNSSANYTIKLWLWYEKSIASDENGLYNILRLQKLNFQLSKSQILISTSYSKF